MAPLVFYEKKLDTFLGQYPYMLKLERKAGIPKARLVAGSALLVLGYALLHLAAPMLTALLIFAYPALMTLKSMDSGLKSEHSLWLGYWVSMALLQLLESFTMGGIARVIPFYPVVKIGLHMWLYLPSTQGSLTVYEAVLRPTLKSLMGNPQFTAATEKFGTMASKLAAETKKAVDTKSVPSKHD